MKPSGQPHNSEDTMFRTAILMPSPTWPPSPTRNTRLSDEGNRSATAFRLWGHCAGGRPSSTLAAKGSRRSMAAFWGLRGVMASSIPAKNLSRLMLGPGLSVCV